MIHYLIILFLIVSFIYVNKKIVHPKRVDCPYPDPTNCQNYYNCLDILMSCGANQSFDHKLKMCIESLLSDCGNAPSSTN
uniref:PlxyGVORF59 protein n=1 Tax=Plutella xylostella granulovirus TaxID=98383 RepID=A0A1B2CSG2_9BBAC|nr:PlxyGVORF59 protein [Plutella xylostella granulovirus]